MALVCGCSRYSSSPDQPLLGVPIREGTLWHLSAQEMGEKFKLWQSEWENTRKYGKMMKDDDHPQNFAVTCCDTW